MRIHRSGFALDGRCDWNRAGIVKRPTSGSVADHPLTGDLTAKHNDHY